MNCDALAPWYRWIEYAGFGGELERRRRALLPEVAGAAQVLLLGDGDGRFLARFLAQNSGAVVDYIDLSRRMLEIARDRAGDVRVTYRQADARTAELPHGHYDLIVTHFFLDCLDPSDAAALVNRVAKAARPDALWLISEFRQPAQGWRAAWAWIWLRILYLFFGVATGLKTKRLVDHHPLLAARGFRLIRSESARFGLLASELWARAYDNGTT